MPPNPTRIVLMVSKQAGLDCLLAANEVVPEAIAGVITIDDRADRRSVLTQIESFCGSLSIPLTVAQSRRHSEDALSAFAPSLVLVVGWYWLIPAARLKAVPGGVLGIHFSDLPKYRGGSPLVWAMINSEQSVGVSLFGLVDEMDAGPIWGMARVPLGPETYVSEMLTQLERAAATLVQDLLPGILAGRARPRPQASEGVSYGTLRLASDGVIDWRLPAEQLAAFVRAQSEPYPGAFTWWGSQKVTIWRARADPVTHFGPPGAVARIDADGVYVVCGDNRPLVLQVVAIDGQDARDASALIRSARARFSMWGNPEPGHNPT